MTREELFRAIGEVREDQIEAAETVKKQSRPWRRFGALAACLALVVTAAAAAAWPKGQPQWGAIIYSFNPGAEKSGSAEDSGGETAAGDLDGTIYWTDDPNRPTHPFYSTGVEIGELSGPGNQYGMANQTADTMWLTPEEIFAQDTVIFRGTVEELQYFRVELDAFVIETYFTRALVRVTDSIRGGLKEGEVYAVGYMGAKGYMTTSLSGPLKDLDVGADAIFMPIRTGRDTGWKEGDSYFCYADLVELYLSEGMRYVFAGTGEGLEFERSAYPALETAETLDDVAAYIREMTGEREEMPYAVIGEEEPERSGGYVFVEGASTSQTEPSETGGGPMGVLPGGAYESES